MYFIINLLHQVTEGALSFTSLLDSKSSYGKKEHTPEFYLLV